MPAFARLVDEMGGSRVSLRVVGPDNLHYFAEKFFPLGSGVSYEKGLYGEDKLHAYRDADFFVLPSYSENFANVVAEALACRTPVITTTETPWREIAKTGCGYYINPDLESLYEAMKAAATLPQERISEMGENGRRLIEQEYLWNRKALQFLEVIHRHSTKAD